MAFAKRMSKTLWKALEICSLTFIFSCASNITQEEVTPIGFEINSFVATDLSEDAQAISTKDDEILIIFGVITTDSSGRITETVITHHHEARVLKDSIYPLQFQYSFSTDKSNQTIFIGLVEYDEQPSILLFERNLLHAITEIKNLTELRKAWTTSLKKSNKFNDNLGIIIQRPEYLQANEIIAGSDLQDSFRYLFHVSFKYSAE